MIKAILFDMDGVLIDAKEWHYDSLNMALEDLGFNQISRHDHETTYDGLPTKTKLEMLAKQNPKILNNIAKINDLKQEFTFKIAREKLTPNKRLIETMTKLQKDGYKMTVCSNSIKETIELFIKLSGIFDYFEFFLSNQDVKKPKPDPEIYNLAMLKLSLKPQECLILEDNHNGLLAAKNSGGHVMKIIDTHEVNYENIIKFINSINK